MVHGVWTHNTLVALNIIGVANGQQIVNVHHFEASTAREALLLTDALAATTAANIANDWHSNCKAAWRALKPADYTLQRLVVQVLERPGTRNHRLVPLEVNTGLPVSGNAGSSATSDDMAAAAVIKWRSVLAGKRHRGRTFVGPLSDIMVNQGRLSTVDVSGTGQTMTQLLTAYIDAMVSTFVTGELDWPFTIYSRPYDAPDGAYTVRGPGGLTVVNNTTDYDGDSTFIVAGSVDDVVRTQRRRQIAVGS